MKNCSSGLNGFYHQQTDKNEHKRESCLVEFFSRPPSAGRRLRRARATPSSGSSRLRRTSRRMARASQPRRRPSFPPRRPRRACWIPSAAALLTFLSLARWSLGVTGLSRYCVRRLENAHNPILSSPGCVARGIPKQSSKLQVSRPAHSPDASDRFPSQHALQIPLLRKTGLNAGGWASGS